MRSEVNALSPAKSTDFSVLILLLAKLRGVSSARCAAVTIAQSSTPAIATHNPSRIGWGAVADGWGGGSLMVTISRQVLHNVFAPLRVGGGFLDNHWLVLVVIHSTSLAPL